MRLFCRKTVVLGIALTSCLFGGVFSANADVPDNIQAIFNANCTSCHGTVNPSGNLSLADAATSEAQLVEINSSCNAALKRVASGEPENSSLYQKISQANPACGGVMPPSGGMLSQADQNAIFDWIVSLGPAAQFGLIQMEMATASVNENAGTLDLKVVREQGTEGQVTVDYAVAAVGTDTAVATEDFVADSNTLVFLESETEKTISIGVVDDDFFEGAETFSVTLSNVLNGAVLGSQAQTKVTINDNEVSNEPGTFLFSAVGYTTSESETGFEVTVLRSFGAAGQVTVDIMSTDGTAVSGMDYTAINQTLVFDDGVKSISLPVIVADDQEEESNESFNLSLSNPTNGALLGNPNSVAVSIADNDGNADDGDDDDSGNDDSDNETPSDDPQTEADYEAAGSLGLGTFLLLSLLYFTRRRITTK